MFRVLGNQGLPGISSLLHKHNEYFRSICGVTIYCIVSFRHEAIMLQKLSIALLSSAPKITCYAFKKMLIIPKIMPLILANNVN